MGRLLISDEKLNDQARVRFGYLTKKRFYNTVWLLDSGFKYQGSS